MQYGDANFWVILLLTVVVGRSLWIIVLMGSEVFGKGTEEKSSRDYPPEPGEPMLPEENIGKDAVSISSLVPSGHVRVEGMKFPAISDVGFVDENSKVRILDIRMHQYVVRDVEE